METKRISPNPKHKHFFTASSRVVLFYGGAGSGKSYSVADKLIIQAVHAASQKTTLKAMIVRKSFPSLRRTCFELIVSRLDFWGVPYEVNRADSTINILGSRFYFISMNNPAEYEKAKSMTDIDLCWIEEANEITEDAYSVLNLRLRGGNWMKQMILSFNPISITNWIYGKFWSHDTECLKVKVTVDDNPYIDKDYIQRLDELKSQNEKLYQVYRLGEWGSLQDCIYTNWQDSAPPPGGEVWYGLDFGFNNPAALVKVTEYDRELYVEELVYQTRLTNAELIERIKPLVDRSRPIYCDSAEPKSIQDLQNAGFQAIASDKSVKAGIDFCQSRRLRIIDGSDNLRREISSYSWQKKADGTITDEPVKFADHAMDSMRYAIYTHLKSRAAGPANSAKAEIFLDTWKY